MTEDERREKFRQHLCEKGERWKEFDGRGIFLTYVCDLCREAKLSQYRPEILGYYTQEDVDEPIEPEDGDFYGDFFKGDF